jgi:tripartite ATP-independent transporter DctP family solute receptor
MFSLLISSCGSRGHKYAWVLATASPENTVTGIFANTFAQKVDELSEGKLKLQVYHNAVLGGDVELIESCQSGDIPFVVQNTAPEVSYMPRLCLFDLPCVFEDMEQLHAVLDDTVFQHKINSIYQDAGFHLLGLADQHFRVMTCNVDLKSLDDFRGIKIRTMENSFHIDFWDALGANPTPLAFSELYVALEQHTVDAQENPYEVICSNAFYEVQDYVIQTNHLPHLLALVTNHHFYEKLSAEERAIVDRAASEASAIARAKAAERVSARMKEIEDYGCKLVPVSEELHDEMKERASALYEKIRNVVSDDELFQAYVKGGL